jgi:hypothetical protein
MVVAIGANAVFVFEQAFPAGITDLGKDHGDEII